MIIIATPYFEPNTTIKLLHNIPFDNTFENTWWFDNPTQQRDHFSKTDYVVATLANSNYQRFDEQSVNVNLPIGKIYDVNYMMFQNNTIVDATGYKWFYAFVTNVEYVNPNTTRVYYEIDVMQTFLHDVTLRNCFIERQHNRTDNIGDNLVNESFNNLEYETATTNPTHPKITNFKVVIQSSELITYGSPVLTPEQRYPNYNCGVYDGTFYAEVDVTDPVQRRLISTLGDKVIQVYAVPDFAFPTGDYLGAITDEGKSFPLPYIEVPFTKQYETWNGWQPKNKKLYTSPYMFINVTDYAGHNSRYYYEYFDDVDNIKFLFECAFNNGGSMRISPLDYKNAKFNYHNAMTINNLPSMSITKDSLAVYMQNNGLSAGMSALTSLIPTEKESKDLNSQQFSLFNETQMPQSLTKRLVSTALNLVGNSLQANARPDTAITSAYNIKMGVQDPATVSQDTTTFGIYSYRVPQWQAKLIDDFFTMYGYAQNKVATPDRVARQVYTYVKTNGCACIGKCPNAFIKKINAIYDNGIRFWARNSQVGNYSVANPPLES